MTAHAADPAFAGNLTGVIAFLYGGGAAARAVAVRAAHTADLAICAGNRTGVIAFLYGAAVVVNAAHTADKICAGHRTGVVAVL